MPNTILLRRQSLLDRISLLESFIADEKGESSMITGMYNEEIQEARGELNIIDSVNYASL